MIVHLKKNISENEVISIAEKTESLFFKQDDIFVLVSSSSVKELPPILEDKCEKFWIFPNDNQLSSSSYIKEKRKISINGIEFGGNTKNTVLIGGPCSVENEQQIMESATFMSSVGIKLFRGGAFKPRTSPYSFQGLGIDGLKLLQKVKEKFGMSVITEARDATHINEIIEYTDIIQIGAKAMYDQGILRACSKTNKPILIKRGFGSTLQEFVQAAEFVLSGGNQNVILCERGIRTFETGTRFTLDLCGVAWLKNYTNLPIILDPSHAMGYSYGVADLARACVAMGIDGLLIESHPNPKIALSDASQQLNHKEFFELKNSLNTVAKSINYNII